MKKVVVGRKDCEDKEHKVRIVDSHRRLFHKVEVSWKTCLSGILSLHLKWGENEADLTPWN